jgi:hypothetical protein
MAKKQTVAEPNLAEQIAEINQAIDRLQQAAAVGRLTLASNAEKREVILDDISAT